MSASSLAAHMPAALACTAALCASLLAAILALVVYMGAAGVGDLIAAFVVYPLASDAYGSARAVSRASGYTAATRGAPCVLTHCRRRWRKGHR